MFANGNTQMAIRSCLPPAPEADAAPTRAVEATVVRAARPLDRCAQRAQHLLCLRR
jgi:hypothetical protein